MSIAWVYIIANKKNGTIYTGVTSNLTKRILQHKKGYYKSSFTEKYACKYLVRFSEYNNIYDAIVDEKKIKGRNRKKKIELIEKTNPLWEDLAKKWFV